LLVSLKLAGQEAEQRRRDKRPLRDDDWRIAHCSDQGLIALLQDPQLGAHFGAQDGKTNGRRYANEPKPHGQTRDPTFDFDRMVVDAGDMAKQGMGEAPRFIAFASLSMPATALRQMMDDVTRAGGVVVFRGLTQGSAKVMTDALSRVLKPGEQMDGVGIDPRLFRAFGIEAVPTYVVTSSDFDLCDGFDCTTAVPPFDRMSGNVTTAHALTTFAQGSGPGAKLAAQHLARLERQKP
jgi:conjugal transfer pilus assembly protein TrbC